MQNANNETIDAGPLARFLPRRWMLRLLSIRRGSLTHLLSLASGALLASGVVFWAVEPTARSLGDGLWLAFATASTVGYGDVAPTSWLARIFACFVVLVGFAILSLVTAAVAAYWVSTDERTEVMILLDLKAQIDVLQRQVSQAVSRARSPCPLRPRSSLRSGPANRSVPDGRSRGRRRSRP